MQEPIRKKKRKMSIFLWERINGTLMKIQDALFFWDKTNV